jgi:hypothetical protein
MRIFLSANSHGRTIYIVAPNVSDAIDVATSIKRFCKDKKNIRHTDVTDEMIATHNLDLTKFVTGQLVRKNTRKLGIHWANA